MIALYVGMSFLLLISIFFGNVNSDVSRNENQIALVRVGVPLAETEHPPLPNPTAWTQRSLKAIYRWPDKEFCLFRFKVEALEISGADIPSKYFLLLTLGHRLFDILELPDKKSLTNDDVKSGRFILRRSEWSCDRVRLEYPMVGGGCAARDYHRTRTFTWTEGGEDIIVEDWRWEADDDECAQPEVTTM